MKAEARGQGSSRWTGSSRARIQIVTIEQAMALCDRAVQIPLTRTDAFRKPAREEDSTRQSRLDL